MWCGVSARRCVEVVLTIPDNEARTALATLQRLGVPAAALERADLYRFAVDESAAERLGETFAALEPVFNPNKHALRVRDGDRPLPGEIWVEMLDSDEAVDRTAPADAPVRIAGRLLTGVTDLTRAVAWRLFDAAGEPADPQVVRSATELLCNPAFQKATTA
jgi:hypothetical protein